LLKHLTKRTKVLLIVFVGLVVIASGVLTWGTLSGAFSSSASGLGGTPIAGYISGEVHDSASGTRLAGASASAKSTGIVLNKIGATSGSATSGTDGVFRITNLTSGTYSVTVTKAGYDTWTKNSVVCTFYRASVRIGFGSIGVGKNFDNCNLGVINLTKGTTPPQGSTGSLSGPVFINGAIFKIPACSNDTACKLQINFTPASPSGNPYNAVVNNVGYYINSYGPPLAYVSLPAGRYTISSASLIVTNVYGQKIISNGKATPSTFDVKAAVMTSNIRLDFTE